MKNHKAQVEVTFNWIYILIAGGIILLFFVGIVFKQKAVSEEALTGDVLRIMETILTGAGLSEKTKNKVDISGLSEYTLFFNCQEGVGEYGIKGQYRENAVDPIFSPREIKGSQLNLWSLPYHLPFKVIDFLILAPENTKYFLVGQSEFFDEFLEETEEDPNTKFRINREHLPDPWDLASASPGKNFQVRIVDATGAALQDGVLVPPPLNGMEDDKVTGLSFVAENLVDFYQKKDGFWEKLNREPVSLVSLGGERDAAKYGAVFSDHPDVYQCNMNKAFRRLKYLNEIYGGVEISYGKEGGKLGEMIEYYQQRPELALSRSCAGYLALDQDNLLTSLMSHQNNVAACLLSAGLCPQLIVSAGQVQAANRNLIEGDCLTLY